MTEPSLFTNPVVLGQLAGSIFGVLILLLPVKWVISKLLKNGYPIYLPYLITIPAITTLAAFGFADGSAPEWTVGFFSYLPAHAMWFAYDAFKLKFEENKKISVRGTLVSLVILYGLGMIVYGSGVAVKERTKIGWLKNEIKFMNTSLPLQVDEETLITHVSFEAPKSLIYHSKLVNISTLTGDQKQALVDAVLPEAVQYFCHGGAPDMKKLGVTIVYRYEGNTGDYLMDTALNLGTDC